MWITKSGTLIDIVKPTSSLRWQSNGVVNGGCIMRATNNFAAQEGMCRERAAVAKREMEYWLAEAEEWKKLRESSDPFIGSIPIQLDWCAEPNNH